MDRPTYWWQTKPKHSQSICSCPLWGGSTAVRAVCRSMTTIENCYYFVAGTSHSSLLLVLLLFLLFGSRLLNWGTHVLPYSHTNAETHVGKWLLHSEWRVTCLSVSTLSPSHYWLQWKRVIFSFDTSKGADSTYHNYDRISCISYIDNKKSATKTKFKNNIDPLQICNYVSSIFSRYCEMHVTNFRLMSYQFKYDLPGKSTVT